MTEQTNLQNSTRQKWIKAGIVGLCILGTFWLLWLTSPAERRRRFCEEQIGEVVKAGHCYNAWVSNSNDFHRHHDASLNSDATAEKIRQLQKCADVLDAFQVPTDDFPRSPDMKADMVRWRDTARQLVTAEMNYLNAFLGDLEQVNRMRSQEKEASNQMNEWLLWHDEVWAALKKMIDDPEHNPPSTAPVHPIRNR